MPITPFDDDDFRRAFADVLGGARRGASDVGEALATAARIEDGDADAWVLEWVATAGAAWAAAGAATAAGRRVSARAHLLRAATYYATALRLIDRSAEAGRRLELWRRQRACWDRAAALFAGPGRAARDPLRGHDAAGLLLRRARRGARRAAAAGRDEQRGRRGDVADVGARRRGGGRARLPLDDLRRSRPAGGAVRAGTAPATRLGGGPDAGARRDDRPDGRRRRADRGDRRRPGRLLGAARARLRAPARRRGRRPGRRRRVRGLDGAARRADGRAPPHRRAGAVRARAAPARAVRPGRGGGAPRPRRAVRRRPRRRRARLSPRRRGRGDHDPAARHRGATARRAGPVSRRRCTSGCPGRRRWPISAPAAPCRARRRSSTGSTGGWPTVRARGARSRRASAWRGRRASRPCAPTARAGPRSRRCSARARPARRSAPRAG